MSYLWQLYQNAHVKKKVGLQTSFQKLDTFKKIT